MFLVLTSWQSRWYRTRVRLTRAERTASAVHPALWPTARAAPPRWSNAALAAAPSAVATLTVHPTAPVATTGTIKYTIGHVPMLQSVILDHRPNNIKRSPAWCTPTPCLVTKKSNCIFVVFLLIPITQVLIRRNTRAVLPYLHYSSKIVCTYWFQ